MEGEGAISGACYEQPATSRLTKIKRNPFSKLAAILLPEWQGITAQNAHFLNGFSFASCPFCNAALWDMGGFPPLYLGSHFGYHPRPYSLNLLELFDDPLTLMRQVLFQPVLLLPNLIPLKTTDFRHSMPLAIAHSKYYSECMECIIKR